MNELADLQNKLNKIEDVLALLVALPTEVLPKYESTAKQISQTLSNVNIKHLQQQATATINQVIIDSDLTPLVSRLTTLTSNLQTKINDANSSISRWENKHATKKAIKYFFIGLVLGGSLVFSFYYYTFYQQLSKEIESNILMQKKVNWFEEYINSSCKIRNSFFRFHNIEPGDCK